MKFKYPIAALFFLSIALNAIGQINNVLNYSLEQRISCLGFLTCHTAPPQVTHWDSPTNATPDWLNTPCHSGTYGMPQNYAGYQYARSGASYAGLGIDGSSTHYREYITGTLADSLKPNKKYCVEFYVSLADSLWWAESALGAYFSNDSLCYSSSQTILPYTPQIENPLNNIIADKVDWVPISGEFTALGGEIFITLGDFYSDLQSNFDSVGNGGKIWKQPYPNTYYYVDDVSVRELTIANAGKADTVCLGDSVLIGKDTITPGVSFYWLPTTGLSNPNIPQPKASPTTTTTYTLTVINDSIHNCNCTDSVTKDFVTISVCTGINEITNKLASKIYPDPNNGIFTLSISKFYNNSEIVIYDLLGGVVYTSKINSATSKIDLGGESKGMYFYKIITKEGDSIGSGEFIIEK